MEVKNYQQNDLHMFLLATSENENIDAKGPMTWDGKDESAKLAKDIAAFANSRDGGVLVIGKSELDNGTFELTGLSDSEAKSFETTKIANWVNARFEPPIQLQCHQVEHESKQFVILTIAEFAEIPVICTKAYQDQANPKKHLLKQGTIFVRNANAESAPLRTANELRSLIGIATGKRGQELLSMFDSILKGRSLLPQQSDDELFDRQLKQIFEELEPDTKKKIKLGAWRLKICPASFDSNRLPKDMAQLESLVREHSVRLQSEFPPYYKGTHQQEWGIANEGVYPLNWSLAYSGQFILWQPYRENTVDYKSPWNDGWGNPSEPSLEGGQWISFKASLSTIIETMMFTSRFIQVFDSNEMFEFELVASSLRDRRLVTTDGNISLDMKEPCRAGSFRFNESMSTTEFQASWELKCVDAMKRFVDFFAGSPIERSTLELWLERFKNRQF